MRADPWQTMHDPLHTTWPLHVGPVSKCSVAVTRMAAFARTLGPYFHNDVRHLDDLYRFLNDPLHRCHRLDQERIQRRQAILQISPEIHARVIRSRLSLDDANVLQKAHIIEPTDENAEATVYGFYVAEAMKIRRRVIFDTLLANCFAEQGGNVHLRNIQQLKTFFLAGRWFRTYDFSAFYYQFEFGDSVADEYILNIGGRKFKIRKVAMGHIGSVNQTHGVSRFLARAAIELAQVSSVDYDVIIDNVAFSGTTDCSKADLDLVCYHFEMLCAEFHVVIGEKSETSQTITHRGVVYSVSEHSLAFKAGWALKLGDRVAETIRAPSWSKVRSLIGMINYVRCWMSPPPSFFVWKFAARWSMSPHTRKDIPPYVSKQLLDVAQYAMATNFVLKTTAFEYESFIATDACKTGPFAAWGAVYVSAGGAVKIARGNYTFGEPRSISVLELEAVEKAFMHWRVELQRPHFQFAVSNLFLLIDNTAALFCLKNGSSPTWEMEKVQVRITALLVDLHRVCTPIFIPSILNPADGPSRDVPRDEQWNQLLKQVNSQFERVAKDGGVWESGMSTMQSQRQITQCG